MKRLFTDRYSVNGFLLIAASLILISLSYILNRGDLSTAAVIISSVACFVIGIFVFTFSGGDEADIGFVNLLSSQPSINICRISGDLGLKGMAHFLPSNGEGSPLSQFIPVGSFVDLPVTRDASFSLNPPRGMNLIPSGYPLLCELQEKYSWIPVNDIDRLKTGLREVCEDIYRLADQTEVTYHEGTFTLVLHNFRYIGCCKTIRSSAAPVCCRINPCPVCSMLACMVSESLKKPCTFDLSDPDKGDLTLGIRVIDTP